MKASRAGNSESCRNPDIMKSAGSLAGDYSNPSVERNSTASTTNTKKPLDHTVNEHCFARWAARRQIVVDAVIGAFHRELISVGRSHRLRQDHRDSNGTIGDDRSVLLVPDPVRLAIRVEEPTCGFTLLLHRC